MHAFFLTLTYEDRYVPERLDYADISKFVRRYRESTQDTVRYFCVGEYGTKTDRPHWHLIVFSQMISRMPCRGSFKLTQWPYGGVFVGDATAASMGYVARYALKTGPRSNVVGMSRRPGLGLQRFKQLGCELAVQQSEIHQFPSYFQVGKRYYPMDRNGYRVFLQSYLDNGGRVIKAARHPLAADLEAAIVARLHGVKQHSTISLERYLVRELERGKV